MKLVFDIEADDLLYGVKKVWCIVTKDIDTLEVRTFDPSQIEEGIEYLAQADVLIGHNIVGYDLPALKKLYNFDFKGQAWDTLIGSKLLHSRQSRHSLSAWGEVLVKKGLIEGGKQDFHDWTHFSETMLEYCIQDVEVNYVFFDKGLKKLDFTLDYVRLEHDIVAIQTKSEMYGVTFAHETAVKLQQKIELEMQPMAIAVEDILGYSWLEKEYRLKNDGGMMKVSTDLLARLNREYPQFTHKPCITIDRCLIKVPTKITLDTKALLMQKLLELGWKPEWKTEKGSPQMSRKGIVEPSLAKMDLAEVNIGRYFVLKHRQSIVAGFFKHERDGKIPSEADTLGAITGRYTHRKIANLPAPRSLYGQEIRELFGVDKGRVQVGSDLAGIEARMLAHYMNDPEFSEFISGKDEDGKDNDVHNFNKEAIYKIVDIEVTRDSSKTFYYALLYGAGDAKVGAVVGGGAKEGLLLKESYFNMYPGLKKTMESIAKDGTKGFVISLDGRPVNLTKSVSKWGRGSSYDVRKGLNTLLQSSAAIYFKRWIWYIDKLSKHLDSHLMISYHDEGQWSVAEKDVEEFKTILQTALELTDKYYDVKCPNAIDTKYGANWGDCH